MDGEREREKGKTLTFSEQNASVMFMFYETLAHKTNFSDKMKLHWRVVC